MAPPRSEPWAAAGAAVTTIASNAPATGKHLDTMGVLRVAPKIGGSDERTAGTTRLLRT